LMEEGGRQTLEIRKSFIKINLWLVSWNHWPSLHRKMKTKFVKKPSKLIGSYRTKNLSKENDD
jgi:hypothetical protein